MRAKPSSRNGKNVKTSNSNNSNSNSNGKLNVKKLVKENVPATKQPDNSVLRPPIDTSIAGLKQAVKLFETGTPEVIYLLNYECDVIYECRVCRNLFRSLANFISHKRVYCTRRFNHVQASPVVEDHTILVDNSVDDCINSLPQRITARQDLTSIMQTSAAKYYKQVEDKLNSRDLNRCDTTVHLQPIENTTFGVYQTVNKSTSDKLIKNQVSELNKIITINEGVTLGPDGKIIQNDVISGVGQTPEDEDDVSGDLMCSLCKLRFSSKKTLSHHTKTVHESFRMYYTCPCCKNLFSNTWSVHRHLYKVHRKSKEQVRRLRTQIQKKQVRAEKLNKKLNKKVIMTKSGKEDKEENVAWMEQLEDDTQLQRCGGCGRRFERRAALASHAQICHKRLAAFNSAQSSKQKEEKSHESHDLVTSSSKQQSTPTQKIQSEKKIGIQVRMNYCKNSVSSIVTRRSERHRSCEEKDDISIIDTQSTEKSVKERLLSQSSESIKVENDRSGEAEEKFNLAYNSSVGKEPNSSTNKSNNRTSRLKARRLETMCFHLRKAASSESETKSIPEIDKRVSELKTKDKVKASNESNAKLDGISDKNIVENKDKISRTPINNKKTVNLNKNDNLTIDCNSSEQRKENSSYSINLDVNEDSNCSPSLSCAESVVNEQDLLSNELDKVLPVIKSDTKSETSGCNNYEETNKSSLTKNHSCITEALVEKDTIGILTRFKVRSIFKHDNSSADSSISECSDHEELSNADESSLKENFSETNYDDDEQTNLIQKKMSQYIRYKTKQCLICLKKFKMLLHIKHHVADHLALNNYHCLFANCSYATYSKSECIKHLMKTHLKPQEKHRASSLVGEVKSDNCDVGVKKLNKRKTTSEDFHLIPISKDSVGSELKEYDENSVTVVSINDDDSCEVVREECVQTSKIDSSCSEQSDIESRFKQKLKRRKVSGGDKPVTPPIRKCSPDSTTELIETNTKNSTVGAHFRNELEEDKMNKVVYNKENENISAFNQISDIPDNSQIDLQFNVESVDSDTQGKGRDTEEEEETHVLNMETNMDEGNLRRMVMEVIFGGQVVTKAEAKHYSNSKLINK